MNPYPLSSPPHIGTGTGTGTHTGGGLTKYTLRNKSKSKTYSTTKLKIKSKQPTRITNTKASPTPTKSNTTSKTTSKSKSKSKTMDSKQQRDAATTKIVRAIGSTLHNRYKLQSRFLKAVCSRSGVCLAFGRESNKIKQFFENFTDFKYVTGNVKRIGSVSVNGFVNEITYERDGYKSLAVLKSTQEEESDNLYYEYVVGQFLNKYAQTHPCFVETYGLLKYKTQMIHDTMKTNRINPTSILANLENVSDALEKDPTFDPIPMSCEHPVEIAVLIQHFDNVITLHDFAETKCVDEKPFVVELPCLLYQVYSALRNMANVFTHNDLHYENILVYEPFPDGFIEFHYHNTNGKVFTFNCPYIAKLIDYGRCWFDYDNIQKPSPKKIHKNVCNTDACNANESVFTQFQMAKHPEKYDCGEDVGYGWLTPFPNQHHISSMRRNGSNDLRALRTLGFLSNLFTDNNNAHAKAMHAALDAAKIPTFGTAEIITSGLANTPPTINNVLDASSVFLAILKEPNFAAMNQYPNRTKRGELHIYFNQDPKNTKPMEFKPTSFKI